MADPTGITVSTGTVDPITVTASVGITVLAGASGFSAEAQPSGPGPTSGGQGWSTGNRRSTSSANRTTGTTVPTRMDTIHTFRAVARSGVG